MPVDINVEEIVDKAIEDHEIEPVEIEIVPMDNENYEDWFMPMPDSWEYDEMLILPAPEPFDPNEPEPIENVVSPIVIELLNNDLVP